MRYVFKNRLYLLIAYLLDFFGYTLFFPVRFFKKGLPQKFHRILVIRVDHIGDVISATPVIESLKNKFPDSVIDFLVPSWAEGLLEENSFLNNVITFDPVWFHKRHTGIISQFKSLCIMTSFLKCGNYDLAIDLRGDLRHIIAMFLAGIKYRISYGITGGGFLLTHRVPYKGVMHETERNMVLLQPLNIKSDTFQIKLYLSENSKKDADLLKKQFGINYAYTVIHPIPRRAEKAWSIDGFAQTIQYIYNKRNLITVLVGSESNKGQLKEIIDKTKTKAIDLSGMTNLAVLARVIEGADFFLGVDSGPSHIAAAVGVPSVILFSGRDAPHQWAPCGRCIKIVYPGKGKDLSKINVDEVCLAIDEVWRLNENRV